MTIIEALQNPHYKKIWEKVIMNRHLEANSLEEALEMEKEKDDCELLLKDSIFTHNNMVGIKSANIALKTANLSYARIKDIMGAECKIVGRPITLEDITIIIQSYTDYVFKEDGYCQTSIYNDYIIFFSKIIDWRLTKPLHEQTHETWEKIANVID